MSYRFYAVKVGRETGIFPNWDLCKAQVDNFRGAKFKGFNDYEAAENYLAESSGITIEGREVNWSKDMFSPVTYVPGHANGDANHPDCDRGVLIGPSKNREDVRVLYCSGRTIQATCIEDLVWG